MERKLLLSIRPCQCKWLKKIVNKSTWKELMSTIPGKCLKCFIPVMTGSRHKSDWVELNISLLKLYHSKWLVQFASKVYSFDILKISRCLSHFYPFIYFVEYWKGVKWLEMVHFNPVVFFFLILTWYIK